MLKFLQTKTIPVTLRRFTNCPQLYDKVFVNLNDIITFLGNDLTIHLWASRVREIYFSSKLSRYSEITRA